ncbi:MAG: OmpA family protein, partial [Vicingaceae bacterium]|nr:OmpA family protein [Vicingaceae bacterium]
VLPININLDVDYNIYKNFYANFYTRINMKFGNDKNTVHYPTSYAVTPRFDHKRWGVSLPLSYNNIYGFRTGLALRMFNYVSIGTGDLKPLIAPGKDMNVRGLDVFFALRMPILYKAPKDRDKDKVSDKLDKCIDIPGTWELLGCSDVDNDGILDQNDSCVTDSGLVKFNGCPDRDGDDIIDKEDDCPDDAGIPKFNGCPDTDGDGLMDKEDNCPTFPGPIKNKGCPYKLLHTVDQMGDIIETDTLLNNQTFYRFETLSADQDQLFLLGSDDGSPYLRVVLGNDTVTAIKNDKGYFYYKYIAPVEPVEIELMEEEEEILKEAFDNLEFESGKAIIKKSSFLSLEKLAFLLVEKSDWRIKIAGHMDSDGRASSNLRLSKKRAQAVADFLKKNNILENRIDVEFYGETKPIDTNKTKAGRAKNRRVEMEIL